MLSYVNDYLKQILTLEPETKPKKYSTKVSPVTILSDYPAIANIFRYLILYSVWPNSYLLCNWSLGFKAHVK